METVTTDEGTWANNVRNMILKYLSIAGLPESRYQEYLGQNVISTWLNAFTSPTYSMNNYESIETLGDSIVGAIAIRWILSKAPLSSPEDLTNLKAHYVSNDFLSGLAGKEGLTQHLRRMIYIQVSAAEGADIFEALFGAFYMVTEALDPGLGWAVCNNLFHYMFKDVVIDLGLGLGSYTTQIVQMASLLDVRIKFEHRTQGEEIEGSFDISSILGAVSDEQGRIPGFDGSVDKVYYGRGPSKAKASDDAAKAAIEALASIGITKDVAIGIKMENDLLKIDQLHPGLVEMARAYLRDQGYTSWYFRRNQKAVADNPSYKSYSLIGIGPGKSNVLATATKAAGLLETKAAVLEMYANKEPLDPVIA